MIILAQSRDSIYINYSRVEKNDSSKNYMLTRLQWMLSVENFRPPEHALKLLGEEDKLLK